MTRWILAAAALAYAGQAIASPSDPASVPKKPDPAEEAQTLDAPPQARPRVWLGVFIEDALDGGVQVVDVVPNGPCDRAGLTHGDVLIQANGADVGNLADLRRVIAPLGPGDELSLTALRDGLRRSSRVVVAAPPPPGWSLPKSTHPPPEPVPPSPVLPESGRGLDPEAILGLRVEAIPAELRTHLGGPADAGLLVLRVEPSGACSGRIKTGDLLVKANGSPLTREDRLMEFALRGGTLRLDGMRAGRPFASEVALSVRTLAALSREERIRALESSILEMEATIDAMKRELATLKSSP